MVPLLPCPRRRREGFTLIELLVVITIVGILAALLFGVFGAVQTRSRRISAINDMRNVRMAIVSYYTDNRKYPLNDLQINAIQYGYGDTIYGDPGGLYSSADLFNILRAVPDDRHNQDNVLNPSKTKYWEGPLVKNPKVPVSGITSQDFMDGSNKVLKGSLVDPWGNPYVTFIDVDRNADISTVVKYFYTDLTEQIIKTGEPPMGVEFSSLGPDGEWGTKDNFKFKGADDVQSWEPSDKPTNSTGQ